MASFNARITMPAEAKAGEIVEIRVLVRHPMDRGGQVDAEGRVVPRKILNRLTVTYAGEPVFRYDMQTGVSANPFVSFTTRAVETGDLTFEWREDGGATFTRTARLVVT
jgi:sulfur-oxidizing protein SoxZ